MSQHLKSLMALTINLLSLAAVFDARTALGQTQGRISTDTTWSGTVSVVGDIQVDPGVRLTVAAGTVINVASTDAANLGTYPSQIEVLVQGSLITQGN